MDFFFQTDPGESGQVLPRQTVGPDDDGDQMTVDVSGDVSSCYLCHTCASRLAAAWVELLYSNKIGRDSPYQGVDMDGTSDQKV